MNQIASRRGLTAVLAIAAFGICYAEVAASLVSEWSSNNLYSYGFAVPFIAAYIWSVEAQRLPRVRATPDYLLGVPVAVAGMAMLIVGRFGAILALEQASLVVTLSGVVLLVLGRQAFRRQWFALAYLLLMVPIWNELLSRLQDPSRLVSAMLAEHFVQLTGMPMLRQGTIIMVPGHGISVLRECSGVNQLVALIAMVLPAAYLWLSTAGRRTAILAFAVVVSYVSNGIRIAIVSWLAGRGFGDGALTGSSHILQGLGVSAAGYIAIAAAFALLSRSNRRANRPVEPPIEVRHDDSVGFGGRRIWLDVAVVGIMLLVGASRLSATQLEIALPDGLRSLDRRISDWTVDIPGRPEAVPFPGIDDAMVDVGGYPTETGERRFTNVDDELVRAYRSQSNERVDLYVGYYRRQREGQELAGEASMALAAAASSFTLPTATGPVAVNEIVRDTPEGRRGVIFWYDINGRIVTDVYQAKGYAIWDALSRRRTNGAVIMIAWDAPAGARAAAARQHAVEFARELMPVLRRHLPA